MHSIKLLLRQNGIKQSYVADLLMVSPQYLSMVFSGKRTLSYAKEKILMNYINQLQKNA